jgi:hypothetical protein
MKVIITEKQLTSLIEDRPVSNELLIRIWDNELGPSIFSSLTDNGVDNEIVSSVMSDIKTHRDYDGLYNLLKDIGEDELARRLKMFVRKSK